MVHDALQPLLARDRAVIERRPDGLTGTTGKLLRLQVTEERFISVMRLRDRAVLADHVRYARIDEQPCPVAVVAGDVAELVDVTALRTADRGGTSRVELAAELHEVG